MALAFVAIPVAALAQRAGVLRAPDAPPWTSWAALGFFAISYVLVILEERTHIRKSLPMIIAAGVMWILAAIAPAPGDEAAEQLRENVIEFSELFLFILPAVTFVNTMEERQVFDALRVRLIRTGLSMRALFWATGGLAFCMSPVADNLTTTLVMGAVAISIGARSPAFVVPACINIVVAANAGGAFSPFGDVTTLMVWQQGKADFTDFFALFLPSLVNWLVPAAIMSLAVPRGRPEVQAERVELLPGALGVVALFLATITWTVLLHQVLHLPAMLGMMLGLGVLYFYGHFLRRSLGRGHSVVLEEAPGILGATGEAPRRDSFDVFGLLARFEWDTLMFFYGVILCVGALHAFGMLDSAVLSLYAAWGSTAANTVVGLASAVFDNIPLMAAILTVSPEMGLDQWLLVTLTAGVGGSLLSVGSAAGVALMGQARGIYTFGAHLRWSWAVALGYAASVAVHVAINGA
ncbi:MAG: sodium:proton antiporter NhaD [Gemmatimonadaceae bacterium]|nr:sodium:proton antiporter NhaD [Gemmatimonadaceae bacterium]